MRFLFVNFCHHADKSPGRRPRAPETEESCEGPRTLGTFILSPLNLYRCALDNRTSGIQHRKPGLCTACIPATCPFVPQLPLERETVQTAGVSVYVGDTTQCASAPRVPPSPPRDRGPSAKLNFEGRRNVPNGDQTGVMGITNLNPSTWPNHE